MHSNVYIIKLVIHHSYCSIIHHHDRATSLVYSLTVSLVRSFVERILNDATHQLMKCWTFHHELPVALRKEPLLCQPESAK